MNWLKENWFEIVTILLLLTILWELFQISEIIQKVEDGIEVEIVDSVDSSIPSISVPSLNI